LAGIIKTRVFSGNTKKRIFIYSLVFFSLLVSLELGLRLKHSLLSSNKYEVYNQSNRDKQNKIDEYSRVPSLYKPYILWRTLPNLVSESYKTNSLGLRGLEYVKKKDDGVFRIIILGGSAAWGWGASSNYSTIEGYLEYDLNTLQKNKKVEVLNFAECGYTSSQEIILWREISEYNPDLVIHYTGYNDILVGMMNLEPGWNYPNIQEGVLSEGLFTTFFKGLKLRLKIISREIFTDIKSLGLYASIKYRIDSIFDIKENVNTFSDGNKITEIFSGNMLFSTKIAKSLNVNVLIVLQPSLFIEGKPLGTWEIRQLKDHETVHPGWADYYRVTHGLVKQKMRDERIDFIDGDNFVKNVDKDIYLDTVHYSDEGYEIVACNIANMILARGFIR
jgi:lysophospholipase L1-like esterase